MKRFWLSVLLLFAVPAAALAMSQSSVPPKFPTAWGSSAGSAYINSIPVPSQIGITNCRASLTTGFPPLTFVPSSAGGCPPFGADFNGILNQLSQWSQWQGAGAASIYDSAFSASIGGYPSGAVLANAGTPGCFWVSTTDNNASDPDTGGANWNSSCPGGGIGGTSTGTANAQIVTTTPFVLVAGATINFVAGFSNTGPLRVNANGVGLINVFRRSQLGATNSVGGEVFTNQMVTLQYDGTEWQCTSCAMVRVGTSQDFFGSATPGGTLFEDGSCISQTTFADLFAVIGSAYGTCGAGLFALPDTRSRVLVGADNQGTNGAANRITSGGSGCAATTLGTGCGGQNYQLTQGNLPVVTLSTTIAAGQGAHTHSYVIPSPGQTTGGALGNAGAVAQGETTGSSTLPAMSGTTPLGGSDTAFSILQPTLVATKIIQF